MGLFFTNGAIHVQVQPLQVAEIKATGQSSVRLAANKCMNIHVTRIYCPTFRFFRILIRGCLLFSNGGKIPVQIQHPLSCLK